MVRRPGALSYRRQEVYFPEGMSSSDSGLRLEGGQGTEKGRLSENRQLPFPPSHDQSSLKQSQENRDRKTGPKGNTNTSMLEFPQRNSPFLTSSSTVKPTGEQAASHPALPQLKPRASTQPNGGSLLNMNRQLRVMRHLRRTSNMKDSGGSGKIGKRNNNNKYP